MSVRDRLASFFRPDLIVDGHVYGGLAVAVVGGWQLSPAWTLVAAGAALVALGLLVPRGKAGVE